MIEAFALGFVLSSLYLRYRWDADPGWAKRIYGSDLRSWGRAALWGLVVGIALAAITYLAPSK